MAPTVLAVSIEEALAGRRLAKAVKNSLITLKNRANITFDVTFAVTERLRMVKRHMEESLLKAAGEYPVFILIGPRQSGKTALVRTTFSKLTFRPEHFKV